MKKRLLILILAVATCGMMASAATKYEINVAGVEVTSSNCSNVTGGDIQVTTGCSSGYVRYNESDNELVLYNITIQRTGSGSYGVHNRKCDNLTITLSGQCNISCEAEAMMLQKNTKINVLYGTHYLTTKKNDKSAINASGISLKFFTQYYNSASKLYITNTSSTKSTIGGDQGAVIDFRFMMGNDSYDHKPHIYIINYAGHALMNHTVNFNAGCDIHINNNSNNYQGIYNCNISIESPVAILTPYGGYLSNSGGYGTVVTNTGSPANEIYISDDYLAIINSTYFPDAKFRNYLLNTAGYSKGYLMQNDIDLRTTFNDLSGKEIYNLKGIEYFTKLKTLNCNNNYLSSLDVSALKDLIELDCSQNQLTSLRIPSSSSFRKLWCGSNKFSKLEFTDGNLTTLDCGNSPYLTKVSCKNNNLTTLNVANCQSLKVLTCTNNSLTSLNVQGLSSLEELNCNENNLTSLSVQGCNALKMIWCSSNRIKESGMSTLVNSLRTLPEGVESTFFLIAKDDSGEGNAITNAQLMIARNKRWKPMWGENHIWREIPVAGDVNGDGKINVTDITTLVNMILGVIPKNMESGDINGDGKLNVTDVTALVNLILS